MPVELTAIDLFCGAGGLSLGFERAGFRVALAADHNEAAVSTHRRNLSSPAELADLGDDVELPTSSVIAGGPPCQGFSSAGLRRHGDHRNSLVSRFAALVALA